MKHFWFLNFDARILIMIFEWSMGCSEQVIETIVHHPIFRFTSHVIDAFAMNLS